MQSRQPVEEWLAPAKVNLSLHVVGRRADGYHLLDGLVVFTEAADRLTIEPAKADRLTIQGPMAARLPAGGNILTQALEIARALAARRNVEIGPLALTLEKNLPVAAGIGGGSADAAALLHGIASRHPALRDDLRKAAATLGADVPMCFDGCPARISGIGEVVEPLPAFPPLPLVLVNPNAPMETPAVFRALRQPISSPPPPLPDAGFGTLEEVEDYLADCRNDLETAARSLTPSIEAVAEHLRGANARLTRMSGSGATVFGLFRTDDEAAAAAMAIARDQPGWWVVATRSNGTGEIGSRNP